VAPAAPVVPATPVVPAAPAAPPAPAAPLVPANPGPPGDAVTRGPFGVAGGVIVTCGLAAFVSNAADGCSLGAPPPPLWLASAVPSLPL